jgi:hypothetical protein
MVDIGIFFIYLGFSKAKIERNLERSEYIQVPPTLVNLICFVRS